MKRLWPLLLVLLTACQDGVARRENADLNRRVTALEAEVQTLKAQAQQAPAADAVAVTTRASAQNCALQLSRFLEGYRSSSPDDSYPTDTAEVVQPAACQGHRLKWRGLKADAYNFAVLGEGEQVLAEAQGE